MSQSTPFKLHRFEDSEAQATTLAQRIGEQLSDAIATRGHAALAVSGGSTPKALFEALSQLALDWSRVAITLVDERWVPESDARSNARLVRAHLLQNRAKVAQFLPLFNAERSPEAGVQHTAAALSVLHWPLDVVVLGMGEDGHTASFFPSGDHLEAVLNPNAAARVLSMRAPGAGEPRITLTLPVLAAARAVHLLLTGATKGEMLEALQRGDADALRWPIATVLRATRERPEVYWSP
ncbi:MAG: 6-phosphogluconolactonase [Xanthomonadales bacterium]|nr:6-phosphogluconolactonase [Xanthomonadales bacterium]